MMIRKQIYIAPEHEAKLKRLAKANGRSEADIIREAIDALPETTDPILAALLSQGLIDLPGATITAGEAEATYQRYLKKLGDRKLDLTEALIEERQSRENLA